MVGILTLNAQPSLFRSIKFRKASEKLKPNDSVPMHFTQGFGNSGMIIEDFPKLQG